MGELIGYGVVGLMALGVIGYGLVVGAIGILPWATVVFAANLVTASLWEDVERAARRTGWPVVPSLVTLGVRPGYWWLVGIDGVFLLPGALPTWSAIQHATWTGGPVVNGGMHAFWAVVYWAVWGPLRMVHVTHMPPLTVLWHPGPWARIWLVYDAVMAAGALILRGVFESLGRLTPRLVAWGMGRFGRPRTTLPPMQGATWHRPAPSDAPLPAVVEDAPGKEGDG